jgi:carbon storage regulator
MLVLSRKHQEQITIGDSITITVVGVQGGKVRLGIDAPREVPVLRRELVHQSGLRRRCDAAPRS